jgi:hypothetical protein
MDSDKAFRTSPVFILKIKASLTTMMIETITLGLCLVVSHKSTSHNTRL